MITLLDKGKIKMRLIIRIIICCVLWIVVPIILFIGYILEEISNSADIIVDKIVDK